MAQTSVKQLASEVGIPADRLVSRLKEAGVEATGPDDLLSDDDKLALLRYLNAAKKKKTGGKLGSRRGRVSLRRRSTSELHANSGHTVNVEVRKRRTYVNRKQAEEDAKAEQTAEQVSQEEQRKQQEQEQQQREQQAKQAEEKERKEREQQEAERKKQAQREQRRAKAQADKDARRKAAQEALERQRAKRDSKLDDIHSRAKENLRRAAQKHGRTEEDERREQDRKRKELHVAEDKKGRRKRKNTKNQKGRSVQVASGHTFERPTAPVVHDVEIPDLITVAELAKRMAIKSGDLLKQMMKLGVMATINQTVDQETATLLVEEMGHNPKPIKQASAEESFIEEVYAKEAEAQTASRAPVVTIMGHVDHGKTSLLDYIRRTKVTGGEAGGITQHIGAYHVLHDKGAITFIDTPGHAAFTRMRARGAETTDIAILIVAADDGVMPQTIESIKHAKAAKVPIVVAITKVDKDTADVDKVLSGLSANEIIPEDWGGDVQVVQVSSKTGQGVNELLDAVLLQAELAELKAPTNVAARGTVIESSLEKGRGPVATILVKAGTLNRGDTVLAGSHYGRVKALFNETGKKLKKAGPSIPAVVLGLSGTPEAGEEAFVVKNEKRAREIAEQRQVEVRENKLARRQAARLEEVFSKMGDEGGEEGKDLNLLIKGDVQGSVEALSESLRNIPSKEVKIRIISSAVGGISESDVELAIASEAIIIGFNTRADAKAKQLIRNTGVDVRYYSVIYEAIEDVTSAVNGLLGTELREEFVGTANVKDVFRSSRFGAIAGCLVEEGAVVRGLPIRVLRNDVVIYEGELESLRRHKDEVDRVEAGTECGIGVKDYKDVQPGDKIEVFDRNEYQRTVSSEG